MAARIGDEQRAHLAAFGQPQHVAVRLGLPQEQLTAEREPLMPDRMQACQLTAATVGAEHAGNSREYVAACSRAIKEFHRRDRNSFLRMYEQLEPLPFLHELLLEGQEDGLYFHDFEKEEDEDEENEEDEDEQPPLDRRALAAHTVSYRKWSHEGYGSVQGLALDPQRLVELQITQVGVTRASPDDEDMYQVSLAGVSDVVRKRAVFCGVAAIVHSDLREDPRMTLTAACDDVLPAMDAATAGGPCSEARHYRMNWLPFSELEADYLAFGLKMAVDYLPAVIYCIRERRDGQPDFDIQPTADLRLTLEEVESGSESGSGQPDGSEPGSE